MKTIRYCFLLFVVLPVLVVAQNDRTQLQAVEAQIQELRTEQEALAVQAENLKLQFLREDLHAVGLPTPDFIEHQAMFLSYSEEHEQARWVAHIIKPDIIEGTVFRSNDFREDPLINSGTAVEADYFLKYEQSDGSFEYDGFGYDRGHLAPSADFRWSATALSESYFYSNMSPQRPEFNREGWAELEGTLRGYIYRNPGTQLYVVTGGVLTAGLPNIERGVNHVSIPELYYKVALDLENQQAIGFIVPHATMNYPLEHYAVTIDEVEALTGLDFFNAITGQEEIEARVDLSHWLPDIAQGDVPPIHPPNLPRGHYNTVQARAQAGNGRTITVVGKVVSSRYSRSGNLWLNIDKQFPNQIFSVFIKKEDLVNFSGDPLETFTGQVIAVRGEVQDFNGTPTMNLKREERIEVFDLESR